MCDSSTEQSQAGAAIQMNEITAHKMLMLMEMAGDEKDIEDLASK